MYETLLIRRDSLKNVVADGKTVGFCFAVRQADYRGSYLSMCNGFYINVDGTVYPREVQKLQINGRKPRSIEELKTQVNEVWNYDDEGLVFVEKEGGLAPGMHHIEYQQSILCAYGYRPQDEEWIRTPPVPGTGAGAGKTPIIVSFDLELSKEVTAV